MSVTTEKSPEVTDVRPFQFVLARVGFMAIFRGVSDVAMAFSLRLLATAHIRAPRRGAPVPQPCAAG